MIMQTQSIYDDTIDLLKTLDEDQLLAVHSIIVELSSVNRRSGSPLGINSEEEMWSHIDHSLKQAKAGEGRDADLVIDELLREMA